MPNPLDPTDPTHPPGRAAPRPPADPRAASARAAPDTLVIDLDGTAGSVHGARREAQRFLADTTRGHPVGAGPARDVLLVVGELVANACRHAPGPCRLSIAVGTDAVDVAVRDTGADVPPNVLRHPAGGGYGLLVVARLTRGLRVSPVHGGKVVRAAVPLPASE
ncbi:ATP-binding protein [Yinghuangia seranimata]|uniref:ATP-binding protein n=1 Tax=Yinghuangia seranimata TaxID=408067 RepID=UPI00248BA68D|nr:ATP-binding protein [Yinghuangia seranimata]MDI2130919.1 ATP-binding protein [Yinghuangia seranimata]